MSGESMDSAPAQSTEVIQRAAGKPPEERAIEGPPSGDAGPRLDDLLGADPGLLASNEHKGDALSAADLGGAAEAIAAELNQDFAALLADAGGLVEFNIGDKVRGTIVSITHDAIFIDVGGKSEAYLGRRELVDERGELTHKVGDEITAQVVALEGEGLRLSRGALKAREVSLMLEEAAAARIPVEGKVVGHNQGGLEIRLGGRRAFCPRSQVDRDFSEDLESHVGNTYRFIVTRYDPTGRKLVVSRRMVQEQEAKVLAAETRELLAVGAVVDGTVRKVMEFGVFVDLGGIDGLVHVSEISWSRVEHPKEVVKNGQAVRVKILKIDTERDRISLSMKQAEAGPWEGVAERFKAGETYKGKVTRLADFGAFIELAPGLEGLVHISELDWKRRINHPREVVKEGEEVEVSVLEINVGRQRMSLSVKQAQGDPWKDVAGELKIGQKITVVVEKVEKFGIFCVVRDGVTGLLPNSHTGAPKGAQMHRNFRPGQKIEVTVIDLDRRRRKITLSQKGDSAGGHAGDLKAYQKQVREEESKAPSAFALAMMAAREKKK
jgi:small subunit ribosomal protein S1